jgi:hypothetical protein
VTRRAFSPVKPIDPELPKAAVRRLIDQAGGVPRAAIRIGRASSTVYAYADAQAADEMTFAQVAQLTAPPTPACAEYLAMLAGGVFFPMPASDSEIGELTAESIERHGDAVAEVVRAMCDGKMTDDERSAAIVEIDGAIRALVHLRTAVSGKPPRDADGG